MFIGFSAFGQGKKDTCRLTIVDTNPEWTEKYFHWPMIHSFPRKNLRLLYDWSESRSDSNFLTFIARKGKFQLYFVSREVSNFKDTLFFDIDLQNDTTIYFQDFTKGFYDELDSSQVLFPKKKLDLFYLEENDKITLTIQSSNPFSACNMWIHPFTLDFIYQKGKLKFKSRSTHSQTTRNYSVISVFENLLVAFEDACKRLGEGNKEKYQSYINITIYYNRKIAYFSGKAATKTDEAFILYFIQHYTGERLSW